MATYYVDGNSGNDGGDGSSNRPWKTLTKAGNQVQPGDEVRVRTATYYEELTLKVRNTIWKADTGHKPVLDGRYHEGLFRPDGTLPTPGPGSGYLPDKIGNMVNIREEGVVFDGFTVQNCSGTGIGVSGTNTTIRNCRVDFTYDSSVKVNPTSTLIDNVVVENNVCTRSSMRYFDPGRKTDSSPQSVNGVMKMGRTRDGIIRNNIFAFGHGEGINIGKGSYRILVEGNVVHTCNHVHIYINRSIDTIIRNNLVYHLYTKDFLGANNRPPAGIIYGDEFAQGRPWEYSSGGQIYNNIVIGLGRLFMVRNNENNYNTQLLDAYIGFNTFIGGSRTEIGVQITGNLKGRPHKNSIFENNIITNAPVISQASGDLKGILFRNNLWDEQPYAAMRGSGDRIGNPNLANPKAEVKDSFPRPDSNVDPRNYQLTSRSSLAIGMASGSTQANGLKPPAVVKDFFGANRDGKPDIGAHEYAGVVTALTANFSIGPGQGAGSIPLTVDFTDKSTSDATIASRLWDFGDSGTSTETNPSHTYTTPGTYDVSLTVTDNKGNTDTMIQHELIVASSNPDAPIPDSFRRFVLVQKDNQQVLAYGTQYPDFRCVVIWSDDPFHLMNFNDVEDVVRSIHVDDTTDILWIDPSDMDEPVLAYDDMEMLEQPELTSMPIHSW